ncbi:sensor histidine kinase [Marinoscillum sp.]|uniref:sensor histidine kinase n=1 Tax=Marinoscillum sp. TaxID=2024838 RepID=UPI003BAABFB2
MKKVFISVFCTFFWMIGFCAQRSLDVRDCEDDERLFLNQYMDVLKTDSMIPFELVRSERYDTLFTPLGTSPVLQVGYNDDFYWFRFQVSNPLSRSVQLKMLLGQIGILEGELFQSSNAGWRSLGKIGYQYPFESRPYNYTHYVFPIEISPQTTDTFYLFTDERHAFRVIATALLNNREMQAATMEFYTFFGFITGVLGLFLLLNIYLYFTTKDQIHAWYALYIFLEIAFLFKHDGLDSQFLGMDSFHGYRLFGMAGVSALLVACLVHVIQLFLGNIERQSWVFRLTSFLKYAIVVFGLAHFVIFYVRGDTWLETLILELTTKSMIVGLLLVFVNTVISIYRGYKSAWLVLVGLSVFLIGGMERTLMAETVTYIFPPNLFQVGMLIETTVISFGLMYRYRLFQKEKEQIAQELQSEKETKAGEIIGAQENERKRIAEDLHDDLGSNLAVIQLNLQTLKSEDHRKSEIMSLLEDTSARVRQISHNLMPPQFSEVALEDVINAYFEQLNEESTIGFTFHLVGSSEHFDKSEELIIYRIIMELTSNVLRHSQASESTVQLFFQQGGCELIVEDNGVGFQSTEGGIGLRNVRSRVDYLHGTFSIDSGNKGTTVIVEIPHTKGNGAKK